MNQIFIQDNSSSFSYNRNTLLLRMSRCLLVNLDEKVHLLKMEQLALVKANRKTWKLLSTEIDKFIDEVELRLDIMDDIDEVYYDELEMMEAERLNARVRKEIALNKEKRLNIKDSVSKFAGDFEGAKELQRTLVKEWKSDRVKKDEFCNLSVEKREKAVKKAKDGARVAGDVKTAFEKMKDEFGQVESLIDDHRDGFHRLLKLLGKLP